MRASSRLGAPLDEVAGDRERAAAEADHGLLGGSSARTSRTASSTGANASSGSGTRSRSTSASVRTGSSTHRADALDELDVDPHPEDRGHDVREHHGRVDVVAAHRLQRHLGAELGRVGDLEECVLLADRAVLREATGPPGA